MVEQNRFKQNRSTIVNFWIFFLALKAEKSKDSSEEESELEDDMFFVSNLKL